MSPMVQSLLVIIVGLGVFSSMGGCASGGTRVGNGMTQDEVAVSREEEADKLFDILDVNGDGKISKAEAKSGFQYLIASYDRDGRSEILAAKPGDLPASSSKKKSRRKPTSQEATKAFESLFENSPKARESLSKDEFKKLVVRSGDNPESDPFAAFL